jgi:Zn-finger protein
MTYSHWSQTHAAKHRAILSKLTHLSNEEVIEYFRFENMVEKENDFCLLYALNKKCHEIDNLNCYWCACPYFRFNDAGLSTHEDKTLYSLCSIDSKDGGQFVSDNAIHQDCTACLIPHKEKNIRDNFNRSWSITMEKTSQIG